MNEPYYKTLPGRNPDPERFPLPWGIQAEGNGIFIVLCARGTCITRVLCWSGEDCDKLIVQVNKINEGAT